MTTPSSPVYTLASSRNPFGYAEAPVDAIPVHSRLQPIHPNSSRVSPLVVASDQVCILYIPVSDYRMARSGSKRGSAANKTAPEEVPGLG